MSSRCSRPSCANPPRGTAARRLDGGDVRMVERGERPCFAIESPAGLLILIAGRRQNLDRDFPSEFDVARAIHLAHRPLSEAAEDFVGAEPAARSERHLNSIPWRILTSADPRESDQSLARRHVAPSKAGAHDCFSSSYD